MLKRITIDLTTVESLIFFWQLILEKQKVSELYILRTTELPAFQATYTDNFTHISLRRVLSAISNKEVFIGDNKEQGRFWSNNLWMLEDISYITSLVAPLKTLNLDDLIPCLQNNNRGSYEEIVVHFVPLHLIPYSSRKNQLYVNFFAIIPLEAQKPSINIPLLKKELCHELTKLLNS